MDDWDWELLQETQTPETTLELEQHQKAASSAASSVCDDCGVIRSDYFSLDSQQNIQQQEYDNGDDEEESSDNNPSWVDPTNITVPPRRERISSCSNSDSSDPPLIDPHSDCCSGVVDGHTDIPDIDTTIVLANNVVPVEEGSDGGELLYSQANGGDEEGGESGVSSELKKVVWWKVPLEVVKYCVLRVSPVWSLSMAAAAVMGLVILRRRYLYKIKRKTQGLQLKVTVDDKKVSQFMSRAARLNEAFSVVKRVPIIRPALPAPGMAPWPMVSLR